LGLVSADDDGHNSSAIGQFNLQHKLASKGAYMQFKTANLFVPPPVACIHVVVMAVFHCTVSVLLFGPEFHKLK
jgi:hypothetical protein